MEKKKPQCPKCGRRMEQIVDGYYVTIHRCEQCKLNLEYRKTGK